MPDPAKLHELALRIDAERARAERRRFEERGLGRTPGLATAVLLATAYPACSAVLEAWPDSIPDGVPRTERDQRRWLEEQRDRLIALRDTTELRRRLRTTARAERLRIALQELLPPALGGADVERTAAELAELAELTVEAALAGARRAVFAAAGEPRHPDGRPGQLVVLGMGKLGGRELNAGSDIDLLCFYDTDDCVARNEQGKESSPHQVWTKVVQQMTSHLEDVTEDGFVWRVDHRLRPEGASGPLVNSLAATERYYECFGRLWERAALLRARPVAGDLALGRAVLDMLAPFVWTQRVDPAVAEVMVELAQRSRAERTSRPSRDLKLGPGGIRETEFFVQALQLIWGGRHPRVRTQPTLASLERLRTEGLVTEREEQDVSSAYLALRRAEHAVQNAAGLQTHMLPQQPEAMTRLARALGFDDAAELAAMLDAHMSRIHQLFTSLRPASTAPRTRWSEALAALERRDEDRFSCALERTGLTATGAGGPEVLHRALFDLASHPDAPLGIRSLERHRHLAEGLLDAIADAADPEQASHHLRRFYARVRHPNFYTDHLAQDLAGVRRLVTALGASAFVGEAMASHPELGDLALFDREPPSPEQARVEVQAAVRSPPQGDEDALERQVGQLRRAKSRVVTRVALADLAGEIELRRTTEILSALADESLQTATRFALGLGPDDEVRGLSVIAMGKLGGRDVGYGSDLDVVFVYDPAAAAEDPVATFSRHARRIIQLVSMPHAQGAGYELDTRLRPSGSQGLLVVSLDGFARYHGVLAPDDHDGSPADSSPGPAAARAASWERLALLRARFAAGDPALGERAVEVAHLAAYAPRPPVGPIAAEIHRLRQRMERELAWERPGRYDLKFGRGGLVELEFCVQLLQVEHGAEHPEVRTTDTGQAIDALRAIGALSDGRAETLRAGHSFLRRLEQRIRVVHADSSHLIEEHAVGLGPLARRMGVRDQAQRPGAALLLDRYREVTNGVRRCFEDIVVGAAQRDSGAAS